MRQRLAFVAIAALAAFCSPPAASEEGQVPAQVRCDDKGRLVEIRVLLPEAGVITLQIPPDVCTRTPQAPTAPARPRPAASSARMI